MTSVCGGGKMPKRGDQKVFCSPSYGPPNPRRLTSATPVRGISRSRAVPYGTFWSAPYTPVTKNFTAQRQQLRVPVSMLPVWRQSACQ